MNEVINKKNERSTYEKNYECVNFFVKIQGHGAPQLTQKKRQCIEMQILAKHGTGRDDKCERGNPRSIVKRID